MAKAGKIYTWPEFMELSFEERTGLKVRLTGLLGTFDGVFCGVHSVRGPMAGFKAALLKMTEGAAPLKLGVAGLQTVELL